MSVLTIYRSSAGSGKTRTLAKVYLSLALRYRADYFRHILAVTFTNKATQEMKNRILSYLDGFSRGIENDLTAELQQELKLDDLSFQAHSHEVLRGILHTYSDFSISTIDAFFQRVIRAFTREAGLAGDYRLIVDKNEVLDEVVNELLDEAGRNAELTRWLVEFTLHALQNDNKFDIRKDLKNFAGILLSENFKLVEKNLVRLDAAALKSAHEKLNREYFGFLNTIKEMAAEAVKWFEENNLKTEDFKHGKSGSVYIWLNKMKGVKKVADIGEINKRVRNEFSCDANSWPAKHSAKAALIKTFAETKGTALVRRILDYYDKHYVKAITTEFIRQNFYLFGLTQDLLRKMREYRDQHRAMLLDEAPSFLQNIISESETPFIYEKVGSFYRHFLIDEFQDTSGLQWNNLRPLVINGLDQGYESMVVGDVKQAIYRWRGGNFKLLHEELEKQVGKKRVREESLDTNYRSSRQIIAFNNDFFSKACRIVSSLTGASVPEEAFRDVVQRQNRQEEGYVQIDLIPAQGKSSEWKIEAKEKLCAIIEDLQQRGVHPRDIAILVRSNKEGQEIINHLINYPHSGKAKPGIQYQVVSSELLRIDNAATVNVLLHAMRYLYNPQDTLARAGLSFEYNRIHNTRTLPEVMQVANEKDFRQNLPEDFFRKESFLRSLPLYELTETLIALFDLTGQQGEFAYLQAFQDLVLNFAAREQNDLGEFLNWWEEVRETEKGAIKSSSESNAIQLFTIHKAKGLQFKYVIIPYCNWPMDQIAEKVILWVQTDEEPFYELGVVPVKYNKSLETTYFKDAYQAERANSYLDNLNLMYVAFTRAEKGLFVLAPYTPKAQKQNNEEDSNISGVNRLLVKVLEQSYQLREQGDKLVWGSLPGQEPVESSKELVKGLYRYATYSWRERLLIRTGTAASPETEALREAGIRAHGILSRLHYADELPALMDQLVTEGSIQPEEKAALQQKITDWMGDAVVASWFDRSWKVRTEVPVLLPGGEYRRIDRLLLQDNRAVVVDFKTGSRNPSDEEQMRDYMRLLLAMGMVQVSGYLFYTRSGTCAEVKLSATGRKGKIDNNQLSFGF